jgi:hypothetical protein
MPLRLMTMLLLLITPAAWAQSAPPTPSKSFSIQVESLDPTVSKKLSEQEILKDVNFSVKRAERGFSVSVTKGKPEDNTGETRAFLADLVTTAITQQNRLGFISQTVRRLSSSSSGIPLDRFLALLQKVYPDVDFNDPQVLKVFRKTAKTLQGYFGGMLTEPSATAIFALIEPETAVRGRIISLQNQLKRLGTDDAEASARLQSKIDALKQVLGEGLTGDVTNQGESLAAMQNVLKDQGVPIPTSATGAKVLVDQLYDRFKEITAGKNLPIVVDLATVDRSGAVNNFFTKLDERIAQLDAKP